ncbi:GreA/GreB family elongation factor [Flaviaesturariibacter aridisoli]|uniref:GreA/GreB family elongation factor n=1 Tax=Flaviaesturariibacter aridisoli TaxID=2545761 RepID=A0A4R4E026_9BACT|nr:GreA/GreB family elongation factor [Flaviaesturariibacter aridisoli]TCZ69897.1 GreA/GreB family elongation factor [Flaviaesturariibacter aridisoli]
MRLTLVPPVQADVSRRRVSFVSPIATALIGYRKGDTVRCNLPGGLRTYVIVEVWQEADL